MSITHPETRHHLRSRYRIGSSIRTLLPGALALCTVLPCAAAADTSANGPPQRAGLGAGSGFAIRTPGSLQARSPAPADGASRPATEGGIAGGACGPLLLSQSSSPDSVEPATTPTCANSDGEFFTRENFIARVFSLPQAMSVDCVRFGIQSNAGGASTVDVTLFAGDIVADPFLPPLVALTVPVPDGAALELLAATLPDGILLSAGALLSVQLRTPDRDPAAGGDGGEIFLGSNDDGEIASAYIKAPSCGVASFTPLAAIGYPDAHIVLSMLGQPLSACESAEGDCFQAHATPGCNDPPCCDAVCAFDPFCCEVTWDALCADAAGLTCPSPPVSCGPSDHGCLTKGSPGCLDAGCCASVCAQLAPCCDISWDWDCIDLARSLCCDSCDDNCGFSECEPCVEHWDNNGGCNHGPEERFVDVRCNEVICGRLWAEGNERDTDWFRIDHCGGDLSVMAWSPLPLVVFISDDTCTNPTTIATASGGFPVIATATQLAAGTYQIILVPNAFDGFPCASPEAWYKALVICDGCGQEAPLAANGDVVFPDCLDSTEAIVWEDVNSDDGPVDQLYPGFDTSTMAWLEQDKCPPSLGGELPPELADPAVMAASIKNELMQALADQGYTGPCPTLEEIAQSLEEWDDALAQLLLPQLPDFDGLPPVLGPYVPGPPYLPDPEECYAFGKRDTVFVHGLISNPIFDKINLFGNPPGKELTTWPADAPEFYGNGYWKQWADSYWRDHINRYLRAKGYKNRFLVVCWPSTQRLDVAAHAVLSQISEAMINGTGVEHPGGSGPTNAFGADGFVVLSHSTGALVTDVAMAAANNIPALGAKHVSDHCKAHIALHGTFGGSHLATLAVVVSGVLQLAATPPWVCPMINAMLSQINSVGNTNLSLLSCPVNLLGPVLDSVLVDLIPSISQFGWGQLFTQFTPVRTLTVNGGHPSFMRPFKYSLHAGFDDGVLTTDTQVASPNIPLLWPGRFIPGGPPILRWTRLYDMVIHPARAGRYYVDQTFTPGVVSPLPLYPIWAAASATPYLTPVGMRTSVWFPGVGGPLDSRNRYANHGSYVQSASDHIGGPIGFECGYDGQVYLKTPTGLIGLFVPVLTCSSGNPIQWAPGGAGLTDNFEETLVMTSPPSFYYGGYGPDGDALFQSSCPPTSKLHEITTGRKVTFKIKIFGFKKVITWWIWRRKHLRLVDDNVKMQADYVYEHVLCDGCPSCQGCNPLPPQLVLKPGDLDGNGVVDGGDLGALLSLWDTQDFAADLDGSGAVDSADLGLLLANWG